MVQYTQAIPRQQSANCLSVFDLFVGLALKGLSWRNIKMKTVKMFLDFVTLLYFKNTHNF